MDNNQVVVFRRVPVAAPGLAHGEEEAAFFHGVVINAQAAQVGAAAPFKNMQVFRVVDKPHGIGFPVGNTVFQPYVRCWKGIVVHKKLFAAMIVLALFCLLGGCAGRQQAMFVEEPAAASLEAARGLQPSAQGLSSWMDLKPALQASLSYVESREQDEIALAQDTLAVTWGELAGSLRELEGLLPRLGREPELLAERFALVRIRQGARFSGYYTPELKASRVRGGSYRYPLYERPDDLHVATLGMFSPDFIIRLLVTICFLLKSEQRIQTNLILCIIQYFNNL